MDRHQHRSASRAERQPLVARDRESVPRLPVGIVGQVVFYLFDHFYTDARIVLCYLYFGLLAALLKIREQEWRRNAAAELVADEQG